MPRRRKPPLVVGLAVLGVGRCVVGWLLVTGGGSGDDAASDAAGNRCAQLGRLAGSWVLQTEVTAAGTLGSSGLNGDYTLEVEVGACEATARLAKVGYTARRFSDKEIQRGEAVLAPGQGASAFGHEATFQLRSDSGKGPDMELAFMATDDARLVGTWRQRGERWDRTRLSGFLDGRREGEAKAVLVDQPCAVRCAVACDAAGRDVPDAALQACTSACESSTDSLPACGDAGPLPAEYSLALGEPQRTLDAACAVIAPSGVCDKSPKIGKHRAPSLSAKRLDGGLLEARFVLVGETPEDVRPHFALETNQGWQLSGPLDGLEPGSTVALDEARLFARHLSEGKGRRYVLGEVVVSRASEHVESLVACHQGEAPRCVLVPTRRRRGEEEVLRREVTPIPGAVAISADDDAAGLASGVYTW